MAPPDINEPVHTTTNREVIVTPDGDRSGIGSALAVLIAVIGILLFVWLAAGTDVFVRDTGAPPVQDEGDVNVNVPPDEDVNVNDNSDTSTTDNTTDNSGTTTDAPTDSAP